MCEYLNKSKHEKSMRLEEMQQTAEQVRVIKKGKERMLAEEKQALRYMYVFILYRYSYGFRIFI